VGVGCEVAELIDGGIDVVDGSFDVADDGVAVVIVACGAL